MADMIFLPIEQARQELREVIREEFAIQEEKRKRLSGINLYTKNKAAKILHLAYNTVKRLCADGIIKTTASGLIEESELERYLANS